MASREGVLRHPTLRIATSQTYRDILLGYRDIHLSRKIPKFNTTRDIVISSSEYRDIAFIKGRNLDKKGNHCLPDPTITQYSCKGNFGIEKSSEHLSKQPKIAKEKRDTFSLLVKIK
ncbi:hypothetical protein J1N35_025437 [Gossypium stocksii]|uniref:Uncharacterized protein n=1 Tax=Gossypium stocksii TaxID=47602 RepID=A0A9D3V6J3_9ROSI|nr:hypothetical protein J1N35_025437 [Gossypium stocksii]